MQVSAASASGCPADLDTISEELFRQLSSGQTVNLAAVLSRARDQSQSHSPADAQAGGHTPTFQAHGLLLGQYFLFIVGRRIEQDGLLMTAMLRS